MLKPVSAMFKCLKLARIRRHIISTTVLLAIVSTMTIVETRAELITFVEYPAATPITNQYQDQGVIFSGVPESPEIIRNSDDSDGWLEAWTGGSSASCGTIVATFVDPTDGVTPVEVTNLSYQYFYMWWHLGNPLVITYYGLDGGIIRQDTLAPWNNQYLPPEFPSSVHKFVIDTHPGTSSCGFYFRIDNLRFQAICFGTDADGDGHYTPDSICYSPKDDCDDNDPTVPSVEVCDDGIDNDCDGNADCSDLDCSPNPICYPPGCSGNVEE